jgi:hypothetical protein
LKTWYTDLAADVTRRRRVFAQIGSFHRTAGFLDDVCSALVEAGLRPITYPVDRVGKRFDLSDVGPGSVVVIPDFESVLNLAHPEAHLRRCRPNLQHAGEAGADWLVISRAPESRYPLVDGSSVTIDSATYRMRRLRDDDFGKLSEVASDDAETIARFSGGSRAIADALLGLVTSDVPHREQIKEAGRITADVLTHALRELGPELLAWLERWVFEAGFLRVSTADVRNEVLFELRAAAVADIDPVDESIELFAPPLTAAWRRALDIALSDVLEAPTQWNSVVADLFYIERRLRRALATLLEDRYGTKWATRLPSDMQDRIVESFRYAASPRAQAITDIERPLAWVTLGDLFELIPRFSPNDRLDGLSVTQWRTIADTILPVRNRVSHMRLLRDGDRQAVRNVRWRIVNAASR